MSDNAAWLEKHRTLLTRGLRRVSDEVIGDVQKEMKSKDDIHEKELKRRDDKQQELFLRFNQEVSKNIQLLDENSELRHEFKRLQQKLANSGIDLAGQNATPGGRTQGIDVDVTVPRAEFRHLSEKYNQLSELYEETVRKAKYLEKKVVSVMQKNKDMKENVRQWQEYSAREISKKEGTPKMLSKRDLLSPSAPRELSSVEQPGRVDAPLRTPQSLVPLDLSSPILLPQLEFDTTRPQENSGAPSTTSSPCHALFDQTTNLPSIHDPHSADFHLTKSNEFANVAGNPTDLGDTTVVPNQPDIETTMRGSSQTTQDEPPHEHPNHVDQSTRDVDEDDVPYIISERSLKRKRAPTNKFEVYTDRVRSDGTPDNPYQVKEELFSSPPRPVSARPLLRKETLDLDELGPNAIASTQRRRQLRRAPSNLMNILRHQRSTSEPLIKDEPIENDYPSITNENLRQALSATTIDDMRALSEPTEPVQNVFHALQPRDSNARLNESVNEDLPRKRLKGQESRQLWKYKTVTESGEDPPSKHGNKPRLTPNAARAHVNKQIHASKQARAHQEDRLETPSKGANSVMSASAYLVRPDDTPSARPASRKGQMAPPRPVSRAGKTSESRLSPKKNDPAVPWPGPRNTAVTPSGPKASSVTATPTPIRSRPLTELKVSDFKPNPAYNDGYSFAFTETVRKRADRACLPGCSRPDCCGSHFRTLAAVAPPLTPSEEETLLEEYLGDAYDSMCLTQMSAEEREELVLQARTRQMAARHGKHRQAFERRATPPGFWRVDFPNTQEEEEDRVKAKEMERKMVEERWMEAMRGGGRWLFRDE